VPIATHFSRPLPLRFTLNERRSHGYREQAERGEPEYNGVGKFPDIAQFRPVARARTREVEKKMEPGADMATSLTQKLFTGWVISQ
jgi:hypothetical protein